MHSGVLMKAPQQTTRECTFSIVSYKTVPKVFSSTATQYPLSQAKLRTHNSWVSKYRALLLEIDQAEDDNMNISFEASSPMKPTAPSEIAALLYRDNTKHPGRRHVYTFPRNGPRDECNKPRFIPIWSPTYLPCSTRSSIFPASLGGHQEIIGTGENRKIFPLQANPLTTFTIRVNAS